MERVEGTRRDRLGLLRRRPPLDPMWDSPVRRAEPRSSDELRLLLRLVDRGLLSEEELESQVRRWLAALPTAAR